MELLPHQERVVVERSELESKLIKLLRFLDTEFFFNLDKEDQKLLREQCDAMQTYSDILAKRIERFNP